MPNKRKILWTGPALDDLRDIRDDLSHDRPEAARALAVKLKESVLRLADFPHSGRAVPEFPGTDYREVIVPPYRVVYEARELDIVILRVWHGRMDLSHPHRR